MRGPGLRAGRGSGARSCRVSSTRWPPALSGLSVKPLKALERRSADLKRVGDTLQRGAFAFGRRQSTDTESAGKRRCRGIPARAFRCGSCPASSSFGVPPTTCSLHPVVREGLAALRGALAAVERTLPRYVQKELDGFLECGDSSNGFAWLHCGACE